jgi:hypothetical protein
MNANAGATVEKTNTSATTKVRMILLMAHLPSPKRGETRQPRLKLYNDATVASSGYYKHRPYVLSMANFLELR